VVNKRAYEWNLNVKVIMHVNLEIRINSSPKEQ